jgi:hypothetical protein
MNSIKFAILLTGDAMHQTFLDAFNVLFIYYVENTHSLG